MRAARISPSCRALFIVTVAMVALAFPCVGRSQAPVAADSSSSPPSTVHCAHPARRRETSRPSSSDSTTDEAPILDRVAEIRVPKDVIKSGATFHVVMEATIGTNGRAEKKSIHDIRSEASSSDSTHFDTYYAEVVDAVRESIGQSLYDPASSGGCAVEATVRLPFDINFVPNH